MASGWLRGVVKEVPSGDTLVICGAVKSGPPPEKRITLSSLMAPKLGKRNGSSRDEPFAWASREFLRKLCIGQSVIFKIDYVVDQISREFGSVFLESGQKDNVALTVVSNGWSKVKGGNQQSPYIESLKKAEENAQLASHGLWTKDPVALANAVREAGSGDDGFNATAFFQSVGKGSSISAIVDQVMNGSMLRVTLLPSLQSATIQLCGAQAPSMGRKTVTDASASATDGTNGAPLSAAAVAALAPEASGNPEPFAREAKHKTEMQALNREVTLVVEGVDKYNNLFATVLLPPAGDSLSELLVKEGLAKVMEFSVNMISSGGQKLRDLERAAKLQKAAIWTHYVPAPSNQGKLSDVFVGKIVEVVSGDCVVVKDDRRIERRIQLSSLRAPRMATRDRPADPHAVEAKEFLRKKLVGREVEVKMEYTRKVPAAGELGPGAGSTDRELVFGNIETVPDKGEEKQNVSEMVVARGFAQVVRHRSDEERSHVYDKLLECEELAKQAKRGIHSNKEPAPNRVNDVSQPGNANKAKQYLPFFQRSGKMQAVVEYVLSGHRLKLLIPKEGVCIVFAPSGIKTPSRAQPASGGKPATAAEPYAEDAIAFTREHCMQRDVEVTIESMDRGGTFLGQISVHGSSSQSKPFNLSLGLIKAGLARIQPNMDPARLPDGSILAEAQRQAKEARLKMWEKWTPEQEALENGGEGDATAELGVAGASSSASQEVLEVIVTEVVSCNEFFLQRVDEPRLAWISEQLRAVSLSDGPVIPPELRVGQLCLGQYSLDDQWYRAVVERANAKDSTYDVFFLDYGNREKLTSRRVRVMDATLAAVPAQAMLACLAYVKVPAVGSEHAADAKACLSHLLGSGQTLLAHVSSRERPGAKDKHPQYTHGKLSVTLLEPGSGANIAAELLSAGYAQLPKLLKVRDTVAKEAIQKLQEFEEEARSARRGIFVYGDPGDSDDENTATATTAASAGAWGRAAGR
ncbi:hypothetical protein CEUSTIGMA_g13042.t1 [Chlamydomonas eustigma]|uniref:Ribonuclease n=2 Tax=Chlamydomonas eustigma TaxID=1157962 RepID=A0A250XRC8_9CHLO|nr:hypothetical protein CEUSTIGMA_g13042.t1 [Chlamydomonas eustigma]|eukprot:GAX85627.1 hypothetical protein CEUSTIGMA_g13042.t1 [Chlamydomonas eustigma]